MPIILAIESSCDETAASVYKAVNPNNNLENNILSNIIFSQIDLHKKFGGVIPELASKSHLEKIEPIVACALEKANVTIENIDAIAVTSKPGLPGSLLIGLSFAKALAYSNNKKLIGVNHLEGHIFSACIENNIEFPFLCLTASGGHTALYLVNNYLEYKLLGQTLDDAAGEAFDKVAKLLDLEYPGGPIIEKLAKEVDFKDFFKYKRAMKNSYDFSFSGIKTAVLYDLIKKNYYNLEKKLLNKSLSLKQEVSSSLLSAVADIFDQKLILAFKEFKEIKSVAFVGGVACNNYIRERLKESSINNNKLFFAPNKSYCTDNAAMIAFVAYHKYLDNKFSNFSLDIY